MDLEKMYGIVDWEFLQNIGFFTSMISLSIIIFAISGSLLWNMNKTNHYYLLRGLCQEDHLSSYLFVYCIERLSDIIAKYVLDGDRQPYGRSKYCFSSLQVMCCCCSLKLTINLLNMFCSFLVFKVSLDKSRVFSSKGVIVV